MGVYEGRAQLARALKDLMAKWAEAKGQWTDVRAREFEATYMAPLEADLRAAANAMDNVGGLLAQVKRDAS